MTDGVFRNASEGLYFRKREMLGFPSCPNFLHRPGPEEVAVRL
jgi:hypothetical protein